MPGIPEGLCGLCLSGARSRNGVARSCPLGLSMLLRGITRCRHDIVRPSERFSESCFFHVFVRCVHLWSGGSTARRPKLSPAARRWSKPPTARVAILPTRPSRSPAANVSTPRSAEFIRRISRRIAKPASAHGATRISVARCATGSLPAANAITRPSPIPISPNSRALISLRFMPISRPWRRSAASHQHRSCAGR